MQVGRPSERAWERLSGHRDGVIEFKRLLRGEDGSASNFEFALTRFLGDYRTPRHRHNYDQIRIGLEGEINYMPGRAVRPGTIGYFPEGTSYGPQEVLGDPVCAALQFGGASGEGFVSYDALHRGFGELAGEGTFSGGVYQRVTPEGRHVNVDGYQAVWEHITGRPMRYARPAYGEPILVLPGGFRTHPLDGERGVTAAQLGVFTEARTALALLRLESGATHVAADPHQGLILFVLDGEVTVDGKGPGEPLERWAAVHLEPGEGAEVTALEATRLIAITLPLPASRDRTYDATRTGHHEEIPA